MAIKKYNPKTNEYKMLSQTMKDKTINYLFEKLRNIEKDTNQNFTAGEAFEIYVASVMTGKGFQESMEKHTMYKNPADGGIDVFFFNKVSGTLTLVQTKMKNFEDDYIRKMINTYNQYIKNFRVELHNDNKGIEIIRDFLKNKHVKKVEYVFIGTDEHKEYAINDKFKGSSVKVYSINEFINLAGMDFFKKNYDDVFELILHRKLGEVGNEDHNNDKTSWFVYVNGERFIKQFADLNNFAIDSLFEENIRNRVSKSKFVNEFKNTIENSPEYFHLFNNGLTIVCDFVEQSTGKLKLKKPQIINGQQTVRALIEIYREMNPKIDIGEIEIPIKVIQIKDKETIKLIARYSNNQTAVKESELNFVDDEYKTLVNLANKNGYSLKGKKGTTSKTDILKMSISKGELPLNEVIRSHAAGYHPAEFLGDSKNRISSVVNKYFDDKKYINQVLKEKTFKQLITVIENYQDYYKTKILNRKDELNIQQGMKKTEANKKAVEENKHLKFGISVFYNLSNRNKENNYIDECIYGITNNGKNSDGTINIFKNNTRINEALKEQIKIMLKK